MPDYDVFDNLTDIELASRADYVLAFCGGKMYVPKNRLSEPSDPPRKPDLVVGYFRFPSPHVKTLDLIRRSDD